MILIICFGKDVAKKQKICKLGKQHFQEKGNDLLAITLDMHRQNFWTVWKTIADLFTTKQ